jgi:branched-chain amino acid transport system ATP-binding protein
MSILTVHALEAFYGDFQALFGIDFQIQAEEIVTIIGANGAGKSTFLKALAGQIPCSPEAIRWDGKPIGAMPAHQVVQAGIALVPEGRKLFRSLSVEENLRIGAFAKRAGHWNLARVYELFPALYDKRHQPGTSLSGGQQQMVAIGRALMSNPRLLLCDEVSLGLSPLVVKDIYNALPAICSEGLSVVLVEQDIETALRASQRFYCFMHGKSSLTGASGEVPMHRISQAYFGVQEVAA